MSKKTVIKRGSCPPWTDDELQLFDMGLTNDDICERTGRTWIAVKNKRRWWEYHTRPVQFENVIDTWHKKNIARYRNSLHKGDEVKIMRRVYTGATDKTIQIEDKAIVMAVFPDVVVTNKGHYQVKELLRWRIGGDFV